MSSLSNAIANLPPLDRKAPFRAARTCKICAAKAIPFDRIDFNKYCAPENYHEFGLSGVDITYLRCLGCGFVFTEDFDDWSRESFADLIYNDDYVKVDGEYVRDRPERIARDFAARLRGCENARILDYGSGAGVFVDRMRTLGFRFINGYDPFSKPKQPTGTFDIITCFEVIEHSSDPVETVGDMQRYLAEDGCILFSQTVQPPDILSVRGNWWYLAPRNGHISTFSEESLAELGRRRGLVLYKGSDLYGFAPHYPSSYAARALSTVGPTFTTLRLLAPDVLSGRPIGIPSQSEIYWHPAESDGVWRFRWTGAKSIWWQASWGAVARLQVRVPVLQGVEPGFAAACELEVGGVRTAATLDRGELVAEFDVSGHACGPIALHTPDPIDPCRNAGQGSLGPHGLAILVSQLPV